MLWLAGLMDRFKYYFAWVSGTGLLQGFPGWQLPWLLPSTGWPMQRSLEL